MKATTKSPAPAAEAAEPVSTAVAVMEPPRAITGGMSMVELIARKQLIEDVMRKVMRPGVHYGEAYDGDKKQNLLKPGADTLLMTFQLVADSEVEIVDLGGDHREYRVRSPIRTASGLVVAIGVGSSSTKESKHRWRNAKLVCPKCGKHAIIKGKDEYGGGWLCFRNKDGCGAKWSDGAAEIEKQARGKVENPDPADVWNTCLKMAKKRSIVDGAISATGCSDMFTQDQEEGADKHDAGDERAGADREQQQAAPGAKQQQAPPAAPGASPSTPAPTPPAANQVTDAAKLEQDLTREYGTLQVRAGKQVALKFWKAWPKEQIAQRLDAIQRANVAIKAITDRLGAGAEQLLNGILLDREQPDDVAGILADLEKAAGIDQPPY